MADAASQQRYESEQERLTAKARAKQRTLTQLRQAWEATQFLSEDEVRGYVDGVLREVESDAP